MKRLHLVFVQRSRLHSARTFSCTRAALDLVKESNKSVEPRSSCAVNTVLEGLGYLKDRPTIMALSDDEYPPWLWNLLKPKTIPDDGPGGKAEKVRLRKENRQRIKDQNFMKTQ